MNTPSACPSKTRLDEFISGLLTETECENLENHISQCESCELLLEELDREGNSWLNRFEPTQSDGRPSVSDIEDPALTRALKAAIEQPTHISPSTPRIQSGEADEVRTIGDYEIVATLGRGGMGVVYLARHQTLGKMVAIKVLTERRLHDDAAISRFTREMKIVGKLQHLSLIHI